MQRSGIDTIKYHTKLEGMSVVPSSPGYVRCGVPQWKILGALFFLCYVTDMYTSVSGDCKFILYANGSAILFAHKDP